MQLHQLTTTTSAALARRFGGTQRGLAVLLCVSIILAMYGERATAQGNSFATYYGTDVTNAAADPSVESSRIDPPYSSHFGASRPIGHHVSASSGRVDTADALYAAGASQAAYLPQYFGPPPVVPAAAHTFAPYMYYIVPSDPNAQAQPTISSEERFASLAPGVQWQTQFASVQDEVIDTPSLPPEATGEDGQPRFGQNQEEASQEVVARPLEFLRSQSVLLDKGERQIDIGMEYAIADGFLLQPQIIDQAPDPDVLVVSTIRARQRLVLFPIEFRYGVTDNIQAFCNIPFGWANAELAIPGLLDEWGNRSGIADVNCGVSALLHESCNGSPDVIGTFSFTAPTGDADFFVTAGAPNSRIGEGFWAVSTQLLFIHTVDPCVVFYSFGYRHRFDETFRAIVPGDPVVRANPGEQIFYQLGVGFAANERITLSTSFTGAYVTEDHVNGVRVQGGITEPMRMRFSATIAKECKIIEPFAEIGMTRDAAASRFGITWTY